jgi:hypothetical protein
MMNDIHRTVEGGFMNRHLSGRFLVLGLICVTTGCNLHLTGANVVNPTVLALAQTALYQTGAAKTGDGALESPDAPLPENTVTLTPTATSTPTITLTNTPDRVTITVSQNTNCRTGPEKQFDLVGIMMMGETAEAIGRNEQKTYWVIRLPSNTAKTCWLWYEWATVVGNGDALPIIQSPPTPTPGNQLDFTFNYAGTIDCGGSKIVKFLITNTGSVTWQSWVAHVDDTVTHNHRGSANGNFNEYSDCFTSTSVDSIPPGGTGGIGVSVPSEYFGHLLLIRLTLYSIGLGSGESRSGDFNITV